MGSVSDLTIINTRTPALPVTYQVKERSFNPPRDIKSSPLQPANFLYRQIHPDS